jgi:hypothetical protein
MVGVFCFHIWKWNNIISNCSKKEEEERWCERTMEVVNLMKIYCKHLHKCHNVPPVQLWYANNKIIIIIKEIQTLYLFQFKDGLKPCWHYVVNVPDISLLDCFVMYFFICVLFYYRCLQWFYLISLWVLCAKTE